MQTFKTLATAALIGMASAPAVLGDEHTSNEHIVIILGDAFFPRVTYADPGDTVRFINSSEGEQTIVGKDDNWSVGPITVDSEASFVAFSGMKNAFFTVPEETGGPQAEGAISFNAAPLSN